MNKGDGKSRALAFINGAVWIDTSVGVTGTMFPIGTPEKPVSNITDANTIAIRYNLKKFILTYAINFDAAPDSSIIEIEGIGYPSVDMNGYSSSTAKYKHITLNGNCPTSYLSDCLISAVSNVTQLVGTNIAISANTGGSAVITVNATGSNSLVNISNVSPFMPQCYAYPARIVMSNPSNGVSVKLWNAVGNFKFTDMDYESSYITVAGAGAHVTLDTSCVSGSAIFEWNVALTNNSSLPSANISDNSIYKKIDTMYKSGSFAYFLG